MEASAKKTGYTMSVDGGGTKIVAMLVDQDYRLLGIGRGGAITDSSHGLDVIRTHMEQCIAQCLDQVPEGEIMDVYIAMPGPVWLFLECLQKHRVVGEVHRLSEGRMALMGAIQVNSGAVAISGTGSIVFRIEQEQEWCAGGEGYLLGDEGSGYAIGRCALQGLFLSSENPRYPTGLHQLLVNEWGRCDPEVIIQRVYHSANPRTVIATISRYVAAAAQAGDSACIALFAAAGRRLADQVLALLPVNQPDTLQQVTVAGSVWYGHRAMYEAYVEHLTTHDKRVKVRRPRYEPVVGGVILAWITRYGPPSEEVLCSFDSRFSAFCCKEPPDPMNKTYTI